MEEKKNEKKKNSPVELIIGLLVVGVLAYVCIFTDLIIEHETKPTPHPGSEYIGEYRCHCVIDETWNQLIILREDGSYELRDQQNGSDCLYQKGIWYESEGGFTIVDDPGTKTEWVQPFYRKEGLCAYYDNFVSVQFDVVYVREDDKDKNYLEYYWIKEK